MLPCEWKSLLSRAQKRDASAAFGLGAYFFSQQSEWSVCASAYWLERARVFGSLDAVYLLSCLHIEKNAAACIGYDPFVPSAEKALLYAKICCDNRYLNCFSQKCIILAKIGLGASERYNDSLRQGLEHYEDWCVLQKTLLLIRDRSEKCRFDKISSLQIGRSAGRLASYGYALASMQALADGDCVAHAIFSAEAGYKPGMLLAGTLMVRDPSRADEGLRWLRAAERAGMNQARVIMADFLSQSQPDGCEANRLYFEAASDGDLSARSVLALRYLSQPETSFLSASTAASWITQSMAARVPVVLAWLKDRKNALIFEKFMRPTPQIRADAVACE